MWRVNLPSCVKSIPNSCLTPKAHCVSICCAEAGAPELDEEAEERLGAQMEAELEAEQREQAREATPF